MKLVGRELIDAFIKKHADSKGPLQSWVQEVCKAEWSGPQDIKDLHRSADFLKENRVIFNIKGNIYRLLTRVGYPQKIVRVIWVGTHSEYDKLKL